MISYYFFLDSKLKINIVSNPNDGDLMFGKYICQMDLEDPEDAIAIHEVMQVSIDLALATLEEQALELQIKAANQNKNYN